MADSSSKEAMRALAVFLGAYMQGKQADKERAAKDHWEQVHYDLAKQQLAISEKNASADRAMRQAAYDLDEKQFNAQQAAMNTQTARSMEAAKLMGAQSPEHFKMKLDQQNSDAMASYRESRSPDSATSQIAAFSTAIDDTRFEMGQVQQRMSDLQRLMSDPMADAAAKEMAIAELAQLQPRYQQLDVELTNLKGRRMNLMGVTPQIGGSPAPDATKSGAAQMPKTDEKAAQKQSGMSSSAKTLSNAFRAAGEIYSQPFTGPRTAAGKPMKDSIGFNMEKALKSGRVTDEQLAPFIKQGQQLVPRDQFGERKVLETGEAAPLIDVTDPLGLGIGAGIAGVGTAGLGYVFRKELGTAGRALAKKAGEKGAKKVAAKVEKELKDWQPEFDAPDFSQYSPTMQDLLRLTGPKPKSAASAMGPIYQQAPQVVHQLEHIPLPGSVPLEIPSGPPIPGFVWY